MTLLNSIPNKQLLTTSRQIIVLFSKFKSYLPLFKTYLVQISLFTARPKFKTQTLEYVETLKHLYQMNASCLICGMEQDLAVKLVQSGGCEQEFHFCALCSVYSYDFDCQFDNECEACLNAFNNESLSVLAYQFDNGEWVPATDSSQDSDSD